MGWGLTRPAFQKNKGLGQLFLSSIRPDSQIEGAELLWESGLDRGFDPLTVAVDPPFF